MTHLVRIAMLLAAFAAAGCVANADVGPTSSVSAEPVSLWAEMHAAIPANQASRNAFEYN